MLVRLTMNTTEENYRSQQDNSLCRLCGKEIETTEHVLGCSAIENDTIDAVYLKQVDNLQMWKKIVDRVEDSKGP